jgi:fermentation-respiration switch protein FrsA (DUF1100 family)
MAKAISAKLLRAALVFLALVTVIPPVLLVEAALRRPTKLWPAPEYNLEQAPDSSRVSIAAHDGVSLVGTFLPTRVPQSAKCLVLHHGVGSNRLQMPGLIRDLPLAGYSVLTIDSRAHGESGGETVSYGLLERQDLRRWVGWLTARPECAQGVYALGLSMGAAIVLQALEGEPRVKAAAVESPFASFREIGRDRIHQIIPALGWLDRPMVEAALLWARLGRQLDLGAASPYDAAPRIQAPILLIHGTADHNIELRHSESLLPRLRRARLWKVDGAQHVQCYGRDPARYLAEVTRWFAAAP